MRFTWWGSEAIGWVKRVHSYDWNDDVLVVVRDTNDNLFTVYAEQIVEVLSAA